MKHQENPAEGGRYEIKRGKRVQVEAPTREHPEGNRARDADVQVEVEQTEGDE
jgi:hypothetical protein